MTSAHDPGGTQVPPNQTALERETAYIDVERSEEFQELRARHRRFVIPVTLGALAFYFLYVILAAYSPGFMGEKVVGNFNIGLIFGLLQFVMTFAVTAFYISYARRVLDPASEKIRDHMHAGGLR